MGLSAGLSTTVPDPVGNDGTTEGLIDAVDEETRNDIDNTTSAIADLIDSWWDLINFWPIFFISMVEETMEATYDVLVKTDLIGNTEIVKMDIVCLAAEGYSEEELGEITTNSIDVWIDAAWVLLGATLLIGLEVGLKTLKANQFNLPVLVGALILWGIGFVAYLCIVDILYDKNLDNAFQCFLAIMGLLILVIFEFGERVANAIISSFLILSLVVPALYSIFLIILRVGLIIDTPIIMNICLIFSMTMAVIVLIWYAIKYLTLHLIAGSR